MHRSPSRRSAEGDPVLGIHRHAVDQRSLQTPVETGDELRQVLHALVELLDFPTPDHDLVNLLDARIALLLGLFILRSQRVEAVTSNKASYHLGTLPPSHLPSMSPKRLRFCFGKVSILNGALLWFFHLFRWNGESIPICIAFQRSASALTCLAGRIRFFHLICRVHALFF